MDSEKNTCTLFELGAMATPASLRLLLEVQSDDRSWPKGSLARQNGGLLIDFQIASAKRAKEKDKSRGMWQEVEVVSMDSASNKIVAHYEASLPNVVTHIERTHPCRPRTPCVICLRHHYSFSIFSLPRNYL